MSSIDRPERRPVSHDEGAADGSIASAAARDRAVVYEHLCQLSELREVRLLAEDDYLARRAELLIHIRGT
ncbi:hypothetical protein BH24ACT26_BH24ACT26_12270 [soil metagenome]